MNKIELVAGAKAAVPALLGTLPFALITGAFAIQAGMPLLESIALSVFFFAGASQVTFAQLHSSGLSIVSIAVVLALINFRFFGYGAAVVTTSDKLKPWERFVIPYFLTDISFGLSVIYKKSMRTSRFPTFYIIGVGLVLWSGWLAGCTIGAILGAQVPTMRLTSLVPLVILTPILVRLCSSSPAVATALLASTGAIMLSAIPYRLGTIIAGVAATLIVVAIKINRKEV